MSLFSGLWPTPAAVNTHYMHQGFRRSASSTDFCIASASSWSAMSSGRTSSRPAPYASRAHSGSSPSGRNEVWEPVVPITRTFFLRSMEHCKRASPHQGPGGARRLPEGKGDSRSGNLPPTGAAPSRGEGGPEVSAPTKGPCLTQFVINHSAGKLCTSVIRAKSSRQQPDTLELSMMDAAYVLPGRKIIHRQLSPGKSYKFTGEAFMLHFSLNLQEPGNCFKRDFDT